MAAPPSRARMDGPRIVALFLAAYGLDHLLGYMHGLLPRLSVVRAALEPLLTLGSLMLYGATFLVPFVMLARMLGRRFRREGAPFSLGFAAFAARHPVLLRYVLPWTAAAIWLYPWLAFVVSLFVGEGPGEQLLPVFLAQDAGFAVGGVLSSLACVPALRYVFRRLAEPETPTPAEAPEADETRFAAVAVTRTTRGAVGALALASAGTAAFLATSKLPPSSWFVAAFVLSALGAASLFRKVSRIAVGIDGILVRGAGRTQFVAYADVDEVWKDGTDLVLIQGARVVMRLQLVDANAARAGDLVARIRAALERSAAARGQGVDLLMKATGAEATQSRRLASSSLGAVDYRQPALAREQLWEVVEGPAAGKARTVAAEALLEGMDDTERARLRVAADACADPAMRVALQRLVPDELDDHDDHDAPPVAPAKRLPGRAY